MRDLSDEPETWIETLTTGWAPDVKKNDKMSFPHLAICVMVSTHPGADLGGIVGVKRPWKSSWKGVIESL